jgi:uncharacterized protein YbaP (TraB family)
MRAFTTLLTVLTLLAWLAAPAGAAETIPHAQGRLWKVTDGETGASYVLGTIHSDNPRVLDLDPKVERIFAGADRYAFELDFGQGVDQKVARAMINRDGRELSERLDATHWRQLVDMARERGVSPQGIDQLHPWAAAATFAQPQAQPRKVLDRVLYGRARQKGGPIEGLETVGEQLAVFQGIGEAEQLDALRRVIELGAEGELQPMFERLTQAWLDGDLARLVEITEANPIMPDPASQKELQRRLVDERNARMAERMQSLVDRGGAFIAIGALHLPGERGVLRRLERAGYTVERVE